MTQKKRNDNGEDLTAGWFYQDTDGNTKPSHDNLSKIVWQTEKAVENISKDVDNIYQLIRGLNDKVEKLTVDMAVIKTRATIYGAIIGATASIIANYVMRQL